MPYTIRGPKGGLIIWSASAARLKRVLPGLRARFGRVTVTSNPPLKDPPPHTAPPVRTRMVAWAHWSLEHTGTFRYTETSARSGMFHMVPGSLATKWADCSQWYASIGHWVGLTAFGDTDYTGSLLQKGRPVRVPKPGDCVIFGPGTGDHAAMVTERDGSDWWICGFGHWPGAPDRVLLSALEAYFVQQGKPGVRFLAFTT